MTVPWVKEESRAGGEAESLLVGAFAALPGINAFMGC